MNTLTIARGPDVMPTTTSATTRQETATGRDLATTLGDLPPGPVQPIPTRRNSRAHEMATTITLLFAMVGMAVMLTQPSGTTAAQPGAAGSSAAETLVLAGASVRVAPGQSIQAAIDSAGAGATVVIGSGVHSGQSVVPLDNMVITGEAGAVLDGAGAPLPYAIYGDASNVTISNLEIRSYTKPIWGANNYRHQGAIHGALMNSGGGFIAIARNWRIESNNIHNNAGWGVSPGDGFTVTQNVLHHNGMAGIGGGDFNGGLIEKNDIYANNDPSNSTGDFNYSTGRPWAWAWNAAGIKVANVNCRSLDRTGACSSGTPLIIRSNNVHDNRGVGIWCDINCNDVTIEKNLVERNIGVDSVGIFYEISQNGRIRDNVVRSQGASGDYLSPSGILVWSSDGVVVERNQVEGTANAIVGNARPREFNRTLRNLTVRDNVILTQGRSTRVGIASDSASDFKSAGNSFNNNYYDNLSLMSYWWTDKSRCDSSLNLEQWRALGFTPASAPPASPTTPAAIVPAAPAPAPAAPTPTTTTTPATTTTTKRPTSSTTTASPATTASTATTAPESRRAVPSSTVVQQQTQTSTTSTPVANNSRSTLASAGGRSPAASPAGPGTLTPNSASPAATIPSTNTSVVVAPVETAPEPLALALDEPDGAATSDDELGERPPDDAAAPIPDPAATAEADEAALAFGVTITDAPATPGSALLDLLSVLGLAIAAVAIWLTGRSLTRLHRPASDQVPS